MKQPLKRLTFLAKGPTIQASIGKQKYLFLILSTFRAEYKCKASYKGAQKSLGILFIISEETSSQDEMWFTTFKGSVELI